MNYRPRTMIQPNRPIDPNRRHHLSDTERQVWATWNALSEDCESPVKAIARDLGMANADVAFIVFPPDTFGVWFDDQESDL